MIERLEVEVNELELVGGGKLRELVRRELFQFFTIDGHESAERPALSVGCRELRVYRLEQFERPQLLAKRAGALKLDLILLEKF